MANIVKSSHRKNRGNWSPRKFRVALAKRGWNLKRLWVALEAEGCPCPSYQFACRSWPKDGAKGPSSQLTVEAIARLLHIQPAQLMEP